MRSTVFIVMTSDRRFVAVYCDYGDIPNRYTRVGLWPDTTCYIVEEVSIG